LVAKKIIADVPDETLIVFMRRYETENGVIVDRCIPMMYVPHTPWQGFLFAMSEIETLGERAAPVMVFCPVA